MLYYNQSYLFTGGLSRLPFFIGEIMATETHVHLNDGSDYTFTVLLGGYSPDYSKGERVTLTSTAKHDVVYPTTAVSSWAMVLKCSKADLDNLKTLYAVKGTVNFTDNLGTDQTDCYLLGNLQERSLIPILDGTNAVYHVPIRIMKKNA